MLSISQQIANELSVREVQVGTAIALLDEGATVPFIARYRKEATEGLDDTQLRQLNERLSYLRELAERRDSVLASIEEQGKLTPELKASILAADTKTRLEDLYLPYKKKRRTKGQIAIESGLEPLADAILADHALSPEQAAEKYVDAEKDVADVKAALDGAKFILIERFAEDADLIAALRRKLNDDGSVRSKVMEGKEQEGEKFADYFDYEERFNKIPPHRALALFRGRREGVLSMKLDLGEFEFKDAHPCEAMIANTFDLPYAPGGAAADAPSATAWLSDVARWTWRVKLMMQVENDLLAELRAVAEEEAIRVFALNLKDLLLASPAGQRPTLGLDPGLRTGVKVAVIDATGQYCAHDTIYPHVPQKQWQPSIASLTKLCKRYDIELIAVGNGTASRETEKLADDLIKSNPKLGMSKVVVSEAGASVYSASEYAAKEFPDLDVSIRGAVSIARRLQDPLAELVKIEPQAIGVGQYQHDLSPHKLARALDAVVEDCVNAVGVELNTASPALLSRVSGLSESQAQNIVAWRNENGRFNSREQLKSVPRLGERTFEQAAGFLRIHDGDEPLDRSAVHPESYPIVQRIAASVDSSSNDLLGNRQVVKALKPREFVTEEVGEITIKDILNELEKPGRDPRPEFKLASFKEGVENLSDLQLDMILEGTVTNVTNFGAFVDIGVHQDGLVHISAMSEKFVKDPREVVKAGDIVKVKVMAVDVKRKRVGLTMRLSDTAAEHEENASKPARGGRDDRKGPPRRSSNNDRQPPKDGAMAAAFAKAKHR